MSVLSGLLGCTGDSGTATTVLGPTTAFWTLRLNQHAVMLALQAPYDTVPLRATPMNAVGAPLTGLGAVTFTTPDTFVTVSPTGLVTARHATPPDQPTLVVASLRDSVHGITNVDTSVIVVTETPAPAIRSYSVQPASNDSAKRSLPANIYAGYGAFSWRPLAVDANGDTVCDNQQCSILVHYTSSSPRIAAIDPVTGAVTSHDTGHVVFTAESWVYGVAERDSVDFRIGLMTHAFALVGFPTSPGQVIHFAPPKLVVGVGAIVIFQNFNFLGGPYTITFSDPTVVDSASTSLGSVNIPATERGNVSFNCDTTVSPSCYTLTPDGSSLDYNEALKARRFPVAGTYQVRLSLFPSETYEIDVVPE